MTDHHDALPPPAPVPAVPVVHVPERLTSASTPPVSRWQVVREGLTDVAVLVAVCWLHGSPGWEPWWSAAAIGSIAGLHGVFKAAGKSRGATTAVVAMAVTSGAWAAHKAPWLAHLRL